MKVSIVSGGTGFIGSSLITALLRQGNTTILYTGRSQENVLPCVNCECVGTSLADITTAELKHCKKLFHLAAITDTTNNADEVFEVNATQPLRLFERAAQAKVENIVIASSASVYGDLPCPFKEEMNLKPLNVYAQSKVELELNAIRVAEKNPATKIVGLRFSNVYGPNEGHKKLAASMIYRLHQQMIKGNPILFWNGNQFRDWIYIDDVIRALLLASNCSRSDCYNIGSGSAYTFNQLCLFWAGILKIKREIGYIENPHNGSYQNNTWLDISRAQRCLEWNPQVAIYDGMADLAATKASQP